MRILIADGHALFRDGLATLLREMAPKVEVFHANDFGETVEVATGQQPLDLVLLEPAMPGGDLVNCLQALQAINHDTAIVVVSASENSGDIRAAIEGGAAGYIPKTAGAKLMLRALDLVLSGGVYIPESLLTNGAAKPGWRPKGEAKPAKLNGLTRRQNQVMARLIEGKSNRQIAAELDLAEGTVKVHVTAILKALDVRNRTQAVIRANALGFE